jgi:hypothetical protein
MCRGCSLQFPEAEVKDESSEPPRLVENSEPATVKRMAGGREPDLALNWYCHVRIAAMIDSGVTGTRIAEETGLAESAVSTAKTKAIGIGAATAKRLVKLLGFKTRGELVDAADKWWLEEGAEYAARHHEAQFVRARAQMLKSAGDRSADDDRGRGVGRGRSVIQDKAKKLPKRPGRGRERTASE